MYKNNNRVWNIFTIVGIYWNIGKYIEIGRSRRNSRYNYYFHCIRSEDCLVCFDILFWRQKRRPTNVLILIPDSQVSNSNRWLKSSSDNSIATVSQSLISLLSTSMWCIVMVRPAITSIFSLIPSLFSRNLLSIPATTKVLFACQLGLEAASPMMLPVHVLYGKLWANHGSFWFTCRPGAPLCPGVCPGHSENREAFNIK